MPQLTRQYTDTIRLLSRELLDDSQSQTTPSQTQALGLIHRYASQLAIASERIEEIPAHQRGSFIRHELLNLLTPAYGYAEMLRDGWIGTLTPAQQEHIDVIHESVTALRNHLIAMNDDKFLPTKQASTSA